MSSSSRVLLAIALFFVLPGYGKEMLFLRVSLMVGIELEPIGFVFVFLGNYRLISLQKKPNLGGPPCLEDG